MEERRAPDGGGEENRFPGVGVFRPEVVGVPKRPPFSNPDASPLVGDGGGVEVDF
jgi:hypothetical protein